MAQGVDVKTDSFPQPWLSGIQPTVNRMPGTVPRGTASPSTWRPTRVRHWRRRPT